jgi:hypothetical protein
MLYLRKKQTQTSWLYLTAILLLVYACQIVPHDHSESEHADNHADHHHSRPHTHDANDETDQRESAHHHDLTQHVDSHFFRPQLPELDITPGFPGQLAPCHPISKDESIGTTRNDADIWVPEPIPLAPLDPRAPPALG